ncbi:MAG: FAD-dependent oxidoreductase [Oscillospiraceae bacterium]|nr:FAD-dependent oxidoreductase [Oscillospiraceae bacterium]
MYDVILVGHGPAAVSAALYLRRANKTAALIGKDFGALEKAEKIENYFGLSAPLSGIELAKTGLEQANALGADIIEDEIFDISWMGDFTLTGKKQSYQAKSVVIACGSARKTLPIKGMAEHEGKGVSYCAVCDAFFYRGKTVGVLGAGEYALHELEHLLNVVEKAYLFTNGEPAPENLPDKTTAITEKIVEVCGENIVDSVLLQNGEKIDLSGLFVALGSASAADFARKLGVPVENGVILVDEKMCTMVEGLFAAGDCIGGLKQVATAVAEGAQAAMSVIAFLNKGK